MRGTAENRIKAIAPTLVIRVAIAHLGGQCMTLCTESKDMAAQRRRLVSKLAKKLCHLCMPGIIGMKTIESNVALALRVVFSIRSIE